MRILVVDDDVALLRVIARTLQRDHAVVTVSSATAALACIEAGEVFDALVTDYHLGDKTGAQLIAVLRFKAPELAGRALIISGEPERVSVQTSVADGTPFLAKPFTPTALRAAVSALFATPEERDS